MDLSERIEQAMGERPTSLAPLSGGCVADVQRAEFASAPAAVVKHDAQGTGSLTIEGDMLSHLAERTDLPVPAVLYSDASLLVMEFVEASGRRTPQAERAAARQLADLHAHEASAFGFETGTLIGGLHQPNPQTDSWIEFFREHRLRYMAGEAHRAGRLPARTLDRVRALAKRLDEFLEEPDPASGASLIHGDVWSGNVLFDGDTVAAYLDPAIYYAHPEIELAFITLFGTFGEPFFEEYDRLRGIRPGFFETRRDLYNLYPLLVHVRLFGGGYVRQVERVLGEVGC